VSLVAVAVLVAVSQPVSAASGPLETLEAHLAGFAGRVAEEVRSDSPPTVAVVSFVDDLGGVRRLGVLAAGMLQDRLAGRGGVRVVERGQLKALLAEKDAWLSDLFGPNARAAAARKLIKADYLVLGRLVPAGKQVRFSVRLVETASGSVRASASFPIERTLQVANLLWYVQRPKKKLGWPPEVPPIELSYVVFAQKRMPDGSVGEFTVKDGSVLRSGDQFQVRFTPVSDCWVYIFLFGSTGECETLFPHPGVKLGNFCRGGVTYSVPDPGTQSGGRWFWLDEHPGTETIYLVASYAPMNDIAEVLAEMEKAGGRKEGLSERLRRQVEAVGDGGDESSKNARVAVRDEPADVEKPYGKAGKVLRGRFSCVKRFCIIHKERVFGAKKGLSASRD